MQGSSTHPWDVLVDLSGSTTTDDGLEQFARVFSSRLGLSDGQRITAIADDQARILVGGRVYEPPTRTSALLHAIELAQVEGRGLFVISGAWMPTLRVLKDVAELAAIDPNIGTVQPRFGVGPSGDVAILASRPGAGSPVISGQLMAMAPDLYVTPETDAACIYITPPAVTAIETRQSEGEAAALPDVLVRLRRRGFRNLVANRVIADCGLPTGIWVARAQGNRACSRG